MNNLPSIISSFDTLPVEQCRNLFERLEIELFKKEQLRDEDYNLEEYYSGGMYGRQITIPPGALITGRIYKFDHLEIMLSGDITIVSANGGTRRYQGYNVIEASAGKRQAGFAHEKTVWLTVNQAPEIPIEQMLDYTSVLTYQEYEQFHSQVNRIDFLNLLSEIGMTLDQMNDITSTQDIVDMSSEFDHIYTGSSSIEGIGLFSSIFIAKGDVICPVRILNNRTIAGRYSNHALHPTSKPYVSDGEFFVIARKDLQPGEEITMNYREVIAFRGGQGDLS